MLVIIGILIAMPMIYMGKFDPLAFFDSGVSNGMAEFEALKAKAPKGLSSVVSDKKVQVYKWRDENGVMQFSNTPPPSDRGAEQVVLDPNSNLVKAIKIPEKEKQEPKAVARIEKPNPYSIKGMKKVMDDAKGVEALLKKRQEEQLKMLDGI